MDAPERLDDCGCCAGTDVETPAAIDNRPGLAAIAYRAGTYARFKQSIAARLSHAAHPALGALRARSDDDFSIALVDGFAVMADVLTFYQERLANEAFLRTATDRASVLHLARLLGYELAPGVAADAWLAFALEEARGAPAQAPRPVTIPVGTKVQSVPGPDESPQTFETVAAIEAHVERNAIRAQTRAPQPIAFGLRELYLAGTGHQLAPGDVILIVGKERAAYAGSENWDVRLLASVEPDDRRGLTRLAWREGLGHATPHVDPATHPVEVFAFRQRAALFGHNAPDPRLLAKEGTNLDKVADPDNGTWDNFGLDAQRIDLDQAYPKIVPGSWLALVSAAIHHLPSSLPGYVELYRAATVSHHSLSAFGLSGKVTRVELDTAEHLSWYGRRDTLVLAQSEPLPLAERPVRAPLYGDRVALATIVPGLARGQALAVSGRRQHLRVALGRTVLALSLDDGRTAPLAPGDRLALLAAPTRTLPGGALQQRTPEELLAAIDADDPTPLTWRLADRDGAAGTLVAGGDDLELAPVADDDATVSEIAFVAGLADGVTQDRDRTHLRLATALKACYDRESVAINANVAPATHGETVSELLGSGDAAARDQRFTLKQAPLTQMSADTPSGRRSTLEVRVAGALWTERPSLYGAGAKEHAYAVRNDADGRSTVIFGDGVEGARLPTGQQDVRATYRKELGASGNVRAGQLATLLTRPLGVTAVTNPEPAAGGQDAESLDDARRNAPRTVLTLDRAVSIRDYADFARGFAGVAKAHAVWLASGPARGVFVTVAGPAGAAIEATGKTHQSLAGALRDFGDPLVGLTVASYRAATFRLSVNVKVADDRLADDVLPAVRAALEAAFAFDAREFGQPVSLDEVVAVIHRVVGVVAVDVDALRRTDQPAWPAVRARLFARLPVVAGAAVLPAEILTLDAAALLLGEMT
ncbi:MAG: putative baseplate assembly protein [Burkholderiales bacterium]|nr:putative baseplate assembly protein [Burkholderiales bacterium]